MKPSLHYLAPTEDVPAAILVTPPAAGGEAPMSLDEADAFVLELRTMIRRGRTARPILKERSRYAE